MKTYFLVAALAAAALLPQESAPKKPVMPEIGKPAPTLRLNDQNGKAVSVKAGAREGWTVLAFYPKAKTPG